VLYERLLLGSVHRWVDIAPLSPFPDPGHRCQRPEVREGIGIAFLLGVDVLTVKSGRLYLANLVIAHRGDGTAAFSPRHGQALSDGLAPVAAFQFA
jgi:hypothetical protein